MEKVSWLLLLFSLELWIRSNSFHHPLQIKEGTYRERWWGLNWIINLSRAVKLSLFLYNGWLVRIIISLPHSYSARTLYFCTSFFADEEAEIQFNSFPCHFTLFGFRFRLLVIVCYQWEGGKVLSLGQIQWQFYCWLSARIIKVGWVVRALKCTPKAQPHQ